MERTILHCDLNSYFASVEIMLHPELKGKPVAVGGSVEDRHGIVLAKSDEAKAFGVQTGEAIWQAKNKCPDLCIVEPHYEQYLKYSKFTRIIYSRYTDIIEPFGIDEAWLDLTPSMRLLKKSKTEIAEEIKESVKRETGLTISVGVSFNKAFAKLASDMKKPDAVTVIERSDFRDIVFPLDVGDLIGVGRSTRRTLNGLGIETVGELAASSEEFIKRRLGAGGLTLWRYANGMDNSRVLSENEHHVVKSVGNGTTTVRDMVSFDDVRCVIFDLSQDVSHRLRKFGLMAGSVQLSVRDCELRTRQMQCPLDIATQSFYEMALKCIELFEQNCDFQKPIRSLTVRAINLSSVYSAVQLSFETDFEKHIKREKIEKAIETVREKYGDNSLNMCSLMKNDLTRRNGEKTAVPCAFSFVNKNL